MSIEQVLATEKVEYQGKVITVGEMPLEEQIQYLIKIHFPLLASEESTLWRLEHLYYIINLKKEKVLFRLNRAQRRFFEKVLRLGYSRILILKSRQLGFSTFVAIYFLDKIIFNPNSEALQIAHTQKDATELFNKKIKYTLANLPKALQNILTTNTKRANRIEFSYPDKSTSAISVSNSGRSGTYNYLHISELAKLSKMFPDRAEEIITGTLPSLAIGSIAIIESTAEGMNGVFYEMFNASWKRRDLITPILSKAEFYPVFYNWQFDDDKIEEACKDGLIPLEQMEECEVDWKQYAEDNELDGREMTFYYLKWLQQNRDLDKLHQEYPTTPHEAFIGSGSNFFSLKKIFNFVEKLDDSEWKRYDYIYTTEMGEDGQEKITQHLMENPKGDLWIRKEPEMGRSYVIGGDIAQGLESGDFTAFAVLGLDRQLKAFYKGHCEPEDASRLVRFLGYRYNTALLAIETASDGNWVNTDVLAHLYPNVYLRTSFDDITKTMTKSYGFLTGPNTRKNMLDNMKVWFNKATECNVRFLLDEMQKFVRNKRGKPMAMNDNHDDLIMATAIGLVVMGTRKDVIVVSKPKSLLEHVFEDSSPFPLT